jgi:hypothetical protein
VQGASDDDRKVRGFVGAFVRPHGLDVPATPCIVEAVERVGRAGRRERVHASASVVAGRALVTPIAFAMMVASIERDRWRSWLLRAARPPRLAVRALRRWITERSRSVRRAGQMALGASSKRASVGVRAARRLQRRVWRGSQSAARRFLGGASSAD